MEASPNVSVAVASVIRTNRNRIEDVKKIKSRNMGGRDGVVYKLNVNLNTKDAGTVGCLAMSLAVCCMLCDLDFSITFVCLMLAIIIMVFVKSINMFVIY